MPNQEDFTQLTNIFTQLQEYEAQLIITTNPIGIQLREALKSIFAFDVIDKDGGDKIIFGRQLLKYAALLTRGIVTDDISNTLVTFREQLQNNQNNYQELYTNKAAVLQEFAEVKTDFLQNLSLPANHNAEKSQQALMPLVNKYQQCLSQLEAIKQLQIDLHNNVNADLQAEYDRKEHDFADARQYFSQLRNHYMSTTDIVEKFTLNYTADSIAEEKNFLLHFKHMAELLKNIQQALQPYLLLENQQCQFQQQLDEILSTATSEHDRQLTAAKRTIATIEKEYCVATIDQTINELTHPYYQLAIWQLYLEKSYNSDTIIHLIQRKLRYIKFNHNAVHDLTRGKQILENLHTELTALSLPLSETTIFNIINEFFTTEIDPTHYHQLFDRCHDNIIDQMIAQFDQAENNIEKWQVVTALITIEITYLTLKEKNGHYVIDDNLSITCTSLTPPQSPLKILQDIKNHPRFTQHKIPEEQLTNLVTAFKIRDLSIIISIKNSLSLPISINHDEDDKTEIIENPKSLKEEKQHLIADEEQLKQLLWSDYQIRDPQATPDLKNLSEKLTLRDSIEEYQRLTGIYQQTIQEIVEHCQKNHNRFNAEQHQQALNKLAANDDNISRFYTENSNNSTAMNENKTLTIKINPNPNQLNTLSQKIITCYQQIKKQTNKNFNTVVLPHAINATQQASNYVDPYIPGASPLRHLSLELERRTSSKTAEESEFFTNENNHHNLFFTPEKQEISKTEKQKLNRKKFFDDFKIQYQEKNSAIFDDQILNLNSLLNYALLNPESEISKQLSQQLAINIHELSLEIQSIKNHINIFYADRLIKRCDGTVIKLINHIIEACDYLASSDNIESLLESVKTGLRSNRYGLPIRSQLEKLQKSMEEIEQKATVSQRSQEIESNKVP